MEKTNAQLEGEGDGVGDGVGDEVEVGGETVEMASGIVIRVIVN
jgi:hypothetical protein